MNRGFRVRAATMDDAPMWGAMRRALWPDAPDVAAPDALRAALGVEAGAGGHQAAFLAIDDAGDAIGFAEAALRRDYVNGAETSPVGFLEGWFVAPEWRGCGVGRGLVVAVEAWTRVQGCSELASDTWIDNTTSQAAHRGCGFEETERVVYYHKVLR